MDKHRRIYTPKKVLAMIIKHDNLPGDYVLKYDKITNLFFVERTDKCVD